MREACFSLTFCYDRSRNCSSLPAWQLGVRGKDVGWGLRLDGCDPDGWNHVAMPEQWGGCGDGERRFI